jgi:hypothetical protein
MEWVNKATRIISDFNFCHTVDYLFNFFLLQLQCNSIFQNYFNSFVSRNDNAASAKVNVFVMASLEHSLSNASTNAYTKSL